MSTDMNITRPTSRVNRPPGGATTISFGSDEPPAPPAQQHHAADKITSPVKPPPAPAASVASTPAKPAVEEHFNTSGKVGILIGGHYAHDEIATALVKALKRDGITGGGMSQVDDVSTLPYAAQSMTRNVNVLVVAAILHDPAGTVAPALTGSLTSLALGGRVPIVPCFIVQENLLAAKAVLDHEAAKVAKSVARALHMANGGSLEMKPTPEVEVEVVPDLTPELDDVEELMQIFRASCKAKGARGIHGLARKFKIADDNKNGKLELDEFSKVVKEHALDWTPAQIKKVFDNFDADKSGNIDFEEFLLGVRGGLSERRVHMILLAFEILDADGSGVVELNDIMAKYSADKHPDVMTGKRTKEDVLAEFLDTFDTIEKDGKVTTQEFIKYYKNVSASIDSDDYFELMMRNAWHISGGEGWCANSSNRRVLVEFTDGKQRVCEIKNDLGIGPTDVEAMYKNLVAQGIKDISFLETVDGTRYHPNGKPAAAPAATPAKAAAPAPAAAAPANRRRAPGGASTIQFG